MESATPELGSIAWDSDNPELIVQQVKQMMETAMPPEVDDTGDPIPSEAGVLFIAAPNGVIYQGNTPDGHPAEVIAASGVYNPDTLSVEYEDGEITPVNGSYSENDTSSQIATMYHPSEKSVHQLADGTRSLNGNVDTGFRKLPVMVAAQTEHSMSVLTSPIFGGSISDSLCQSLFPLTGMQGIAPLLFGQTDPMVFAFPRTERPTGISRQVHTKPGFAAVAARVLLPSGTDSTMVQLNSTQSTAPTIPGTKTKEFPSVADIYFGGEVVTPTNATFPGMKTRPNFPVDLGLLLQMPTQPGAPNVVKQWSPFVTPKTSPGKPVISLHMNGKKPRKLSNAIPYDVRCTGEIRMTGITPAYIGKSNILALHLSPILGSTNSSVTVRRVNGYDANGVPQYDSSVIFPLARVTLVYANVPGWSNRPFDPSQPFKGSNQFILKRINSIAQVLNYPPKDPGRKKPSYKDVAGAPIANGPANDPTPGYFRDNSFVGNLVNGAGWGAPDLNDFLLFDSTGNQSTWDQSETLRAGQYPFYVRNVKYTLHNRFFWEDHIVLATP